MTTALNPTFDWYINRLAELGLPTVLTVQAVLILAIWCGLGIAIRRHEQRSEDRAETRSADYLTRVAENYANHESARAAVDNDHQPRKETP
ncbi:hypothetical protein ACWD3J_14240 [Streptomyces sp. NPDC002755]